MFVGLVVQIIIALLIAGFLFWAARKLLGLIPLEPIFAQAINVLLIIVVVAIILLLSLFCGGSARVSAKADESVPVPAE